MERGQRREKGFTLVEMLVVMAITGALAMLVTPVVIHARAKSRTVHCSSNLQNVGRAYAACLMDSNGSLPESYYGFTGGPSTYTVSLKSPSLDNPDKLFKYIDGKSLTCPLDDHPVTVATAKVSGATDAARASYAYNVALPLVYQNVSRVAAPVNTVTFYDGQISKIVGSWTLAEDWAKDTIINRHNQSANYLFLDGHVENQVSYPAVAFSGWSKWVATAVVPPAGGTGGGTTPPASTHDITGSSDIKLNVNLMELVLTSGVVITQDSLKNAGLKDYSGTATSFTVRITGGGGSIAIDGKNVDVKPGTIYTIKAKSIHFELYNDKRDKKGLATGQWHIQGITADDATLAGF